MVNKMDVVLVLNYFKIKIIKKNNFINLDLLE